MMSCRPLSQSCLVALLFCQAMSKFCSKPAEEGNEFTFGPVQVYAQKSAAWIAYFVPGQASTISICTKDECNNINNRMFQGTVGQLIDNKLSYSLKIVNVSRTPTNVEITWTLAEITGGVLGDAVSQCQLQVYAPARIDCQPLHLVNNNQSVSMACDVTTYPQATCGFQEKGNDNKIQDLDQSQVSQGQETHAGDPVYYSRNCSMTVAISKPGNFAYRVVVKTLVKDKPSVDSDGDWKAVSFDPPPDTPLLRQGQAGKPQANGATVTLMEGDTLALVCEVKGGYPAISNVKLVCGSKTVTSPGSSATLDVRVTREMNGGHCRCSGQHVTRAYDKTTQVKLDVLYPSNMTNTALAPNGGIDNRTSVRFMCEANGNPRPVVEFSRTGWPGFTHTNAKHVGEYTARLDLAKEMTCKDTGTYACVASNGEGDSRSKVVAVNVRCPPQIRGSVVKTYDAHIRTNKMIPIPVYGYPKPDRFALSRLTGRQNVRRDRYDVSYQPGQLSNGTVVLELHSLEQADNGSFVLAIGNGQGGGLNFTFNLNLSGETLPEERDMCRNTLLVFKVLTAVFVTTTFVFLSLFLFLCWKLRRIYGVKHKDSTEVTKPTLQLDANYESMPITAAGTARSIPADGYLTPVDLPGNTNDSHNDDGLYSSPMEEPEDASTRAIPPMAGIGPRGASDENGRNFDNLHGERGQAGVYEDPDNAEQGVELEAGDEVLDVATVTISHSDRESKLYGNINIYDVIELVGINQDVERNAYTHIQMK